MDEYKYETKSLDELTVLLCAGAEITGVDRGEGRFFRFILRANFDMEKKTLELASKTLLVNAYDLLEAGRRAKSVIHSR